MLLSKSSSAEVVGDAVEGDAVVATTAIIGACDVGAPVTTMLPVGDLVGDAIVGDLVEGKNVGVGPEPQASKLQLAEVRTQPVPPRHWLAAAGAPLDDMQTRWVVCTP